MNRTVRITEAELKRAVQKSINKVMDKPKRGWGDIGDHGKPERGYYYCEESDYSSGRVRRWIGDENDAEICRMCSEGGAYGPFNSRSDAVNFMKHFDKDYRERYEKIYGKSKKDDSYDELDESKIRRLVKESVRRVLNEMEDEISTSEYNDFFESLSDDLVNRVNNHPLLDNISCTKTRDRQWGSYKLKVILPLYHNFNTEEDISEGVKELVNYISDSLMCDDTQVYGDFMGYPYPKVGSGIFAEVKYIKSSKKLKIVISIPYNVMKNFVDKTYPNTSLVVIDPIEY